MLGILSPILKRSNAVLHLLSEEIGLRQVRRRAANDFAMAVPFSYATSVTHAEIAVVCHLFHPELAGDLFKAISNVRKPVHVYVSTDTEQKRLSILGEVPADLRLRTEVRVLPNRGRDIAPKLVGFADVYGRYDFVLFLHSKKSAHHANEADSWRSSLLRVLAGSPETVDSVLEIFAAQPEVGAVIPQHLQVLRPWLAWTDTFTLSRQLAERMHLKLHSKRVIDFPSGSMFWIRSAALKPLLDLKLTLNDFAEEHGQVSATIAHAIERLFLFSVELAGYTWVKIADRDLSSLKRTLVPIHSRQDLQQFVMTHRFDLLERHGNPPTSVRAAAQP